MMATLGRLVQDGFALLVDLHDVCAVGQKELDVGHAPMVSRNVERGPSIRHGQVGVRPGLEEHPRALLATDLVDPGGDVESGLALLATLETRTLLLGQNTRSMNLLRAGY